MAITTAGTGYLSTGASGLPNTTAAQSIIMWYLVSSYPSANVSYINLHNGTNASVQIGSWSSVLSVWGWGGSALVSAAANPTTGVYHHLAYTYDGTTHRLYIDGVFSNSTTVANVSGAETIVEIFGNQWTENGVQTLDDVRIYNRALSVSEVQTVYACRGIDSIVSGLVSRWIFSEGAPGSSPSVATQIRDLAGTNNGTAFSAALTNLTYTATQLKYRRV